MILVSLFMYLTINKEKEVSNLSILQKFFVFDVETTKLEPMPKNFVFGVIYGHNFKKVIYSVVDFKKEFSSDRYKKKYIFAHNAQFDLMTIYGNLYKNLDTKAIFNGKFISARQKSTIFADSLNILMKSAAKVGEAIGLPKLENDKVWNEGLTKQNITDKDIEYCTRDCEIIYTALSKIFMESRQIKVTLSALSLLDFRTHYLNSNIFYDEKVFEFYDSYYGGRTEAFKIGQTNSKVFDINSLYPFTMANEKNHFPDVSHLKKEINPSLKFVNYALKRFEGMGKFKVKHKDTYFGYIPFRGKNKLLFPIGEFTTHLNFNELRFAIDRGVVEVLDCEYLVYSNPVKSPFIDFIKLNYKKRKSTNDEFYRFYYKIKMNALYGRFAMKKKYQDEYHEFVPYELIEILQLKGAYYTLKRFNKDRDDCFLITELDNSENSLFSIPAWSSYITSYARIKLLKSLLENEANKVTYCDTDSIFLEGSFKGSVGENLGEFKNEHKNVMEIRGLKNYTFIDKEGKEINVIKGVGSKAVKVGKNSFKETKFYKTKEALRRSLEAGKQYEQTKTLTNKYDKRIVFENGETKPLKL